MLNTKDLKNVEWKFKNRTFVSVLTHSFSVCFCLDLISIKYFNQLFETLLNIVQNKKFNTANFGSLRMHKKEIISVPTPVFSPSFFEI